MPRPHIPPDHKARRRRRKRTVSRVAVAKHKKSPEATLRSQTTTAPAIALAPAPQRPSSKVAKPKTKSKSPGRKLAGSLGTAALMFPGGKYGNVVKSALAGAAAGTEVEAALRQYRKDRTAKKGGKTQGTVSSKAATQLSRGHTKDPSKTKRV